MTTILIHVWEKHCCAIKPIISTIELNLEDYVYGTNFRNVVDSKIGEKFPSTRKCDAFVKFSVGEFHTDEFSQYEQKWVSVFSSDFLRYYETFAMI